MAIMKTYVSIRIIKAKDYEEALQKVGDGEFIEDHPWSDIITHINNVIVLEN